MLKFIIGMLLMVAMISGALASLHVYQFKNYIVEYKDTEKIIFVSGAPHVTGARNSDDARTIHITPNIAPSCNHSRFHSICVYPSDLAIDLRPGESMAKAFLEPEIFDPINNTAPNKLAGIKYGKYDLALGGLPCEVQYLITNNDQYDYSSSEIYGIAHENKTLVIISSESIWYPGEPDPRDVFNNSIKNLTIKIMEEPQNNSIYQSGNFKVLYPGADSLSPKLDSNNRLEIDIYTISPFDDAFDEASILRIEFNPNSQGVPSRYMGRTFTEQMLNDPVNNIPTNQYVSHGNYNLSIGGLPGVVKYVIVRYDSSLDRDGSAFRMVPMIQGITHDNGALITVTATGDVSSDKNILDCFNESMSRLKLSANALETTR